MLQAMKTFTSLVACFLVAGCAGISSTDCGTDATALGARDGRLGASPQAELYEQRCGAPIDREKYQAGWRSGYGQRPLPLW